MPVSHREIGRPLHVAFGIAPSSFDTWRERIKFAGVPIESEVSWPEGGRSLYFRDPDRHVIELKTSNWQGRPLTPLREQG